MTTVTVVDELTVKVKDGNKVKINDTQVLQVVHGSIRYSFKEMVDGNRGFSLKTDDMVILPTTTSIYVYATDNTVIQAKKGI